MRAREALVLATRQHARTAMQKVQQRPASTFVNIEGNAIATDVFVIHACDDRCANDVIATHLDRPKAVGVDSESQTLAIKKFSRSQRWRLIGARQNRFFGRIATTDSQGPSSVVTMNFDPRSAIDARLRALIATATTSIATATTSIATATTVKASRYGTLRCRASLSGDR